MTFALELPAWCGPDGFPLSYRHFVHGMAAIGRAALLETLARAQADRIGRYSQTAFGEYQRDTLRTTEVPHDG